MQQNSIFVFFFCRIRTLYLAFGVCNSMVDEYYIERVSFNERITDIVFRITLHANLYDVYCIYIFALCNTKRKAGSFSVSTYDWFILLSI